MRLALAWLALWLLGFDPQWRTRLRGKNGNQKRKFGSRTIEAGGTLTGLRDALRHWRRIRFEDGREAASLRLEVIFAVHEQPVAPMHEDGVIGFGGAVEGAKEREVERTRRRRRSAT